MSTPGFNIKKLDDIGLDSDNLINSFKFFAMLEMATGHTRSYKVFEKELRQVLSEHFSDPATHNIIILKLTQAAGNRIGETFIENTLKKGRINID